MTGGNEIIVRPTWGDGSGAVSFPDVGMADLPPAQDRALNERVALHQARQIDRATRWPDWSPRSDVATVQQQSREVVTARTFESAVFASMPTESRKYLTADFELLTDDARAAVRQELAWGPPRDVEPVSDLAVAHFGTTNEGAQLLIEWGPAAAKNIGILQARFLRIIDMLADTPGEANMLGRWWDNLPDDDALAIQRELVRL